MNGRLPAQPLPGSGLFCRPRLEHRGTGGIIGAEGARSGGMRTVRQRLWIAALVGASVSVLLCLLTYAGYVTQTRGAQMFFFGLQAIGWFATLTLRGIHSAKTADFILIGVPVNALVYALVAFG